MSTTVRGFDIEVCKVQSMVYTHIVSFFGLYVVENLTCFD